MPLSLCYITLIYLSRISEIYSAMCQSPSNCASSLYSDFELSTIPFKLNLNENLFINNEELSLDEDLKTKLKFNDSRKIYILPYRDKFLIHDCLSRIWLIKREGSILSDECSLETNYFGNFTVHGVNLTSSNTTEEKVIILYSYKRANVYILSSELEDKCVETIDGRNGLTIPKSTRVISLFEVSNQLYVIFLVGSSFRITRIDHENLNKTDKNPRQVELQFNDNAALEPLIAISLKSGQKYHKELGSWLYMLHNQLVSVYSVDKIMQGFNESAYESQNFKVVVGEIIYRFNEPIKTGEMMIIESGKPFIWKTLLLATSKSIENSEASLYFIDHRPSQPVSIANYSISQFYWIHGCSLRLLSAGKSIALIQCTFFNQIQCLAYGLVSGCKLCQNGCVDGKQNCPAIETFLTGQIEPRLIFSKFTQINITISEELNTIDTDSLVFNPPITCNPIEQVTRFSFTCLTDSNQTFRSGSTLDIFIALPNYCNQVKINFGSNVATINDPVIKSIEPKYIIEGHDGFFNVIIDCYSNEIVDHIDFANSNDIYPSKVVSCDNKLCNFKVSGGSITRSTVCLKLYQNCFTNFTINLLDQPEIYETAFFTFIEGDIKIKGKGFDALYRPAIEIIGYGTKGIGTPVKVNCKVTSNELIRCKSPKIPNSINYPYIIKLISHSNYLEGYNLTLTYLETPRILLANYETWDNSLVIRSLNILNSYSLSVSLRNDINFEVIQCDSDSFSLKFDERIEIKCNPVRRVPAEYGWKVILTIDQWSTTYQPLSFDNQIPQNNKLLDFKLVATYGVIYGLILVSILLFSAAVTWTRIKLKSNSIHSNESISKDSTEPTMPYSLILSQLIPKYFPKNKNQPSKSLTSVSSLLDKEKSRLNN